MPGIAAPFQFYLLISIAVSGWAGVCARLRRGAVKFRERVIELPNLEVKNFVRPVAL